MGVESMRSNACYVESVSVRLGRMVIEWKYSDTSFHLFGSSLIFILKSCFFAPKLLMLLLLAAGASCEFSNEGITAHQQQQQHEEGSEKSHATQTAANKSNPSNGRRKATKYASPQQHHGRRVRHDVRLLRQHRHQGPREPRAERPGHRQPGVGYRPRHRPCVGDL